MRADEALVTAAFYLGGCDLKSTCDVSALSRRGPHGRWDEHKIFDLVSHAPKHGSNQGSHLPGGVGLGLKSRSQKLGGGVGGLRRVRRVFFCCVVGVLVLTTDIVGAAAGVGVVVSNAAGVGVVVGNAAGVGGITAGVCAVSVAAAGTCWGIDRFAIPNTIATTAEKIPTIPIPIAQRARRCVCSCRASLCLRSISLRISVSRSDAVMISFGGSIESDWISEK